MSILKTYARCFADDLDSALPLYETLVGQTADLRFEFEGASLAAVGDLLLIGGPPEVTDRFRGTVGPLVVDDLTETMDRLRGLGSQVVGGPSRSATGTFAYVRHPDGAVIEYVQWDAEILDKVRCNERVCQ
ncbi:VOC family protein [Gordonia polyisoprenivorans]|uniref:VOC family protein n=1 Tax=Gordonia polyisoprenivorans TaxID=84595 RepID=UPI002234A1AD|nr:VOC family protein [Gordonia polyisoprenivorans]